MTQRMDYSKAAPDVLRAMLQVHGAVTKSGIEEGLTNLVYLRVSQINGCAYCVDMHARDLRKAGETNERIDRLAAWREAPGYSARERAALGWAESLTRIASGPVSDEVYREAREHFSEAELSRLTLAVAVINAWNRFGVGFRLQPD